MEWLWLFVVLIVLIVLCAIPWRGESHRSEYHRPPDYEDDPPPPMGASQEQIDAFDRKRSK